jgi:hypothetical protein
LIPKAGISVITGATKLGEEVFDNVLVKGANTLDDIENGVNWQNISQSTVSVERSATKDGFEILTFSMAGGFFAMAKKPNNQDCDICKNIPERKEFCSRLKYLWTRASGTPKYKTIIEDRLCSSSLSNTSLNSLISNISVLSNDQIKDFLEDIDESIDLRNNLGKIDSKVITTWKYLYENKKEARTILLLAQKTSYQNHLHAAFYQSWKRDCVWRLWKLIQKSMLISRKSLKKQTYPVRFALKWRARA